MLTSTCLLLGVAQELLLAFSVLFFWQPLSCLVNTEVNAHNGSSSREEKNVQTHARAQTHTHTHDECNKSSGGDGRLLSEFLVQLIFVCESGRGYDCSHVDWSEGDTRGGGSPRASVAASRRFREENSWRQKRVKSEARAQREEQGVGGERGEGGKEGGEPSCSNKDPLLRRCTGVFEK